MIPSAVEIEQFIEIYQVRHLTKAAIRLDITQPTLTQSLKRLEEKLGFTLFYRTKQGMEATKQGVLFYREAQKLKDTWKNIQSTLHNSQNEVEGVFTLGCHASVGAYMLPKLFKQLLVKAPQIQLELHHDSSRKILEGIVSYKIDFGYVVNPFRHPDLVQKKIGEDKVIFWKQKKCENIPKILFAYENSSQVEAILNKNLNKYFVGWKVVFSSNLELIRALTKDGLGVGLLPQLVAQEDKNDLVVYHNSIPSARDELFLVYRRQVMNTHAGKFLLNIANIQI